MRERMEKLNIEKKEKPIREVFEEWTKKEIKDASPDVVNRLKLFIGHGKEIPDEDLRLFELYQSGGKIEWEEYGAIEERILKSLREKPNNTRRVFFEFFSDKVKAQAVGEELKEDRQMDNAR